MGYDFTISEGYRIKADAKEYPWPWEGDPDRTIEIFRDDILTKDERGYTKQTGICCMAIQIPDEDLEKLWK